MKNKDLIKILLDIPMDTEVNVGGFDGATGERNWDGGIETVRYDRFATHAFIEFNELFLDTHEDQERETTLHGGYMVRADRLRAGDVIDTEPVYDYFERKGMEFNADDRQCAAEDFETVESVSGAGNGYTVIIVDGSVFYPVPDDFEIEVTN